MNSITKILSLNELDINTLDMPLIKSSDGEKQINFFPGNGVLHYFCTSGTNGTWQL